MNNYLSYNTLVLVTQELEKDLGCLLKRYPEDKVFLITEETCNDLCFPLVSKIPGFDNLKKIILPSGEENKTLASVEKIWLYLSENGADRKSLIVNLGGGMVTDIGGFAASTIKRGMDFINIPTTLLAQVDASLGGKTGFNFNGLKNEIGVINQPTNVLIDPDFLKTLDEDNFRSGFAEMIKHGLIADTDHFRDLRNFDLNNKDYNFLRKLIADSVAVKESFVFRDPLERGYRKALNFGHTIGHAFESFALESRNPIHHGYAVAYGMMTELYLSKLLCNFPVDQMDDITNWLIEIYGKFSIDEVQFEKLYQLMSHDKKNEGGRINFTLIPSVGKVVFNQICTKELIFEALSYFKNLTV